MFNDRSMQIWNSKYRELHRFVLPYSIVVLMFYFILCFYDNIFLIFLVPVYLMIAAFHREIVWQSDIFLAKAIGYYELQSMFWQKVRKPPNIFTWFKMWIVWKFLFTPTYECRIRSLKKWMHKI